MVRFQFPFCLLVVLKFQPESIDLENVFLPTISTLHLDTGETVDPTSPHGVGTGDVPVLAVWTLTVDLFDQYIAVIVDRVELLNPLCLGQFFH
jgi:hypothetical protein